jgi:hypothetical protein
MLSRQQFILLSPLAATLMEFLVCVANKRLTAQLNPLDATLTKKTGVGAQLIKAMPLFLLGEDFQCPSQELRWHPEIALLVRRECA